MSDDNINKINDKDLLKCELEKLLKKLNNSPYYEMFSEFSATAKVWQGTGLMKCSKIFSLLADACSMMLTPKNRNEPFQPVIVFEEGSSAKPDSFSDNDISFFSEIANQIDNPRLKARLSDLVWLRRRELGVRHALTAIDAYREIPLDNENWDNDGRDCWRRAIDLCRMLGKGAGNRITEIEEAIISSFRLAAPKSGYFLKQLVDLLRETGLGRIYSNEIANKLKQIGENYKSQKNFLAFGHYCRGAIGWYELAGEQSKAIEMAIQEAEAFVAEGEKRIASSKMGHLSATSFFEDAIKILQSIPHRYRYDYKITEKIRLVKDKKLDAGAKSLNQMHTFRSDPIDISDLVSASREAVIGKDLHNALIAFTGICPFASEEMARQRVEKILRNDKFSALFTSVTLGSDGKTIFKEPGIDVSDLSSENSKKTIWAAMIRDHLLHIRLVTESCILPALEILVLEHRIKQDDLIALCQEVSIVPPRRGILWGQALYSGFNYDYINCMHILIPQIENMIRWHLKTNDIDTIHHDQNGIDSEFGLGKLLEIDGVEQIFGKDLVFEFRALLCDPLGPNLRNGIAHGLFDINIFQSHYSIYTWWLLFGVIFRYHWRMQQLKN